MKINKNRPCGVDKWSDKHQHFEDIKHENIECGCGKYSFEYSFYQQNIDIEKLITIINFQEKESESIYCMCGGKYQHHSISKHQVQARAPFRVDVGRLRTTPL